MSVDLVVDHISEILDARSGPMEVADDVPLQREKVSTMTAAPV
jgi:hypothetical protein